MLNANLSIKGEQKMKKEDLNKYELEFLASLEQAVEISKQKRISAEKEYQIKEQNKKELLVK